MYAKYVLPTSHRLKEMNTRYQTSQALDEELDPSSEGSGPGKSGSRFTSLLVCLASSLTLDATINRTIIVSCRRSRDCHKNRLAVKRSIVTRTLRPLIDKPD